MAPAADRQAPAIAVASVRVAPGRVAEYLSWQAQMDQLVVQIPGFLRTQTVVPADPVNTDLVVIYKFASMAQLDDWLGSAQRSHLLARAEPLLAGQQATSIVVGDLLEQHSEAVTSMLTVAVALPQPAAGCRSPRQRSWAT